jgi:hypothetical protein
LFWLAENLTSQPDRVHRILKMMNSLLALDS